MINVSELINDPDFCQTFTVSRYSGTWQGGKFSTTASVFSVTGVITPMKTKDVAQLPQGDTILGAIEIFSPVPLLTTRLDPSGESGGTADEVTWKGEVYKILKVDDFTDFGYFYAVGTRKAGA